MADADASLAQSLDLAGVEMDAMRDPGAGREPPGLLQEIDRAHAEGLDAVDVFVERLAEMGVQPAIVALGEFGRSQEDRLWCRERRARRKRAWPTLRSLTKCAQER